MDLYLDKMMQIEQITNTNHLLNQIHIKNNSISARIYPNLGGSIQELAVNNVNIIDGINNDQSGLDDYATTYKSSILFPFPNRIEDGTYEFMGVKLQLPLNEPAVNNAIHGLVYNKEFAVTFTESDEKLARVVLAYKSNGSTPGFPFPFELKLTYKILATGSLKLTFDLVNLGSLPFPYGMGWHPYFVAEQLKANKLSFPSKDFYECDNRSIPVKTLPSTLPSSFKMEDKTFDDAYSLLKSEAEFESDSYRLNLDFDYTDGSYLQIYTPPHGKSMAIEPMTCIANSFNNKIGFKELAPGESDSWTIHLRVAIK